MFGILPERSEGRGFYPAKDPPPSPAPASAAARTPRPRYPPTVTDSKHLCPDCQRDLENLVDDWHNLCDVLRLSDLDRVRGMVLAVSDALDRCRTRHASSREL